MYIELESYQAKFSDHIKMYNGTKVCSILQQQTNCRLKFSNDSDTEEKMFLIKKHKQAHIQFEVIRFKCINFLAAGI